MKNFSSVLIGALNKSIWVDANSDTFKKVNEKAIKVGYLVHPNACSFSVIKFLNEQEFNPNATFWKSWNDVKSRSEEELCFAQALHYVSTYGVQSVLGEDFVVGNGFVPNEHPEVLPFENLKIINAATKEEIFSDLYEMLTGGIALSSKTINEIVEFIKDYKMEGLIDLDQIKNREALPLLCALKKQLPNDEFSMLRVLCFIATNTTMLIKSSEYLGYLRSSLPNTQVTELLESLSEKQLRALSRIFLRYKPIFLALKEASPATINRIRRLAVKNHRPFVKRFWECCLDKNKADMEMLDYARGDVNDISTFKKVQLLEAILYRKQNPKNQFYHIRNGKTYIRADYQLPTGEYYDELYQILLDSLIKSLIKKYKKEDGTLSTIKLPKEIELVVPTSEKSFIGNIPNGSYVKFDTDSIVMGIYWRGEWGTQDYDLHYSSINGENYGWNAYHRNDKDDILYSGDMTRANPEASECFRIKGKAADGVLSIYRYWGESPTSKFKFYVAKNHTPENFKENYMVDPKEINFEAVFETDESHVKQLGAIFNDKLYFTNESVGSGRVPNHNIIDIYKETLPKKLASHIVISDLLKVAGFPLVEENADIDLSNLSKADLINFFTV